MGSGSSISGVWYVNLFDKNLIEANMLNLPP